MRVEPHSSNEVEEWRDVSRYEDRLQVSNFGRIRSKQRLVYFTDNNPLESTLARFWS